MALNVGGACDTRPYRICKDSLLWESIFKRSFSMSLPINAITVLIAAVDCGAESCPGQSPLNGPQIRSDDLTDYSAIRCFNG